MNVTVILFLVLSGCSLVSSSDGRRLLGGEDEITRRNYAGAAAKNTMTDDLDQERDSNSSKVVFVFCVQAPCTDGTCYCCETKQEEVCYKSLAACHRHCQRCDTRCPPLSASAPEARAIRLPAPAPAVANNIITTNTA
ncbi:hypothetical protein ACP4OV_025728 [Aristida adscensionis]